MKKTALQKAIEDIKNDVRELPKEMKENLLILSAFRRSIEIIESCLNEEKADLFEAFHSGAQAEFENNEVTKEELKGKFDDYFNNIYR